MAGIAILDPPEHSVLDVDMDYLWMTPWDAGRTFRIGPLPEVAIRRDRLRCVVQLSCRLAFPAASYLGCFGGLARTCVINLYDAEVPRQIWFFPGRAIPRSRCARLIRTFRRTFRRAFRRASFARKYRTI